MQNMMVVMVTIIQAVCRSDHDLSDDIKMCFSFHVIEQFGYSDPIFYIYFDKECVNRG